MGDFLKCECPHCGQNIEYPSEGTGQTVPCPTCRLEITLPQFFKSRCHRCGGGIEFSENGVGHKVNCPHCGQKTKLGTNPFASASSVEDREHLQFFKCDPTPTVIPPPKQRTARIKLANLTEETIRAKTQTGDTPLHRAAKTGRISEIPKHLLQIELFMARNNSFARETPLHLAAKYGHLDKVPKEFLTKETLTASTEYERKESKTGSTPPRTETPLHYAVRFGHADQIPKEFLTPEFLSIEASGYRLTVLHQLAYANRLDLIPDIYANSEMWNLKDSQGRTPREVLESVIQREAYVAGVRAELT
jgi:ankyrin repeat protein